MPKEKTITRRVSVDFSLQEYEELQQVAQKCGLTMGRVIRQSIKREVVFQEAREKKEKVFIENNEGKQREIVFV